MKDTTPNIPETTEEEIKETIEKIKDKHDVILTHTDAARFAKLAAELRWWLSVEKAAEKSGAEVASGKKEKISLDYAASVEEKRILEEMKKLLEK